MYLTAISLIVTVLLAVAGYVFTYWHNLQASRHQARLDLVNQRLNKFYGPLFIVAKTISTAYQTQLAKSGTKTVFQEGRKPTQQEWDENYAWVMGVYAPLEAELSDLVVHNAHLIREQSIPESLMTLLAHVAVAQALLHKWNKGDFSEQYPAIDFPHAEIAAYAGQSYAELKAEQLHLMGS
jgi:hypothetical protein